MRNSDSSFYTTVYTCQYNFMLWFVEGIWSTMFILTLNRIKYNDIANNIIQKEQSFEM